MEIQEEKKNCFISSAWWEKLPGPKLQLKAFKRLKYVTFRAMGAMQKISWHLYATFPYIIYRRLIYSCLQLLHVLSFELTFSDLRLNDRVWIWYFFQDDHYLIAEAIFLNPLTARCVHLRWTALGLSDR